MPLESLFQCNVVWPMPSIMDNDLMAMFYNKINCSSCSGFLLGYLGCLSKQYFCFELLAMFRSKDNFTVHCIDCIYNAYIYKALDAFTYNAEISMCRDDYLGMLRQ